MCGCDDEKAMCSVLGIILSVAAVLIGAVFLCGEDGGGMKCCAFGNFIKIIIFGALIVVCFILGFLICSSVFCCFWGKKTYVINSGSSSVIVSNKGNLPETAMNNDTKCACFINVDKIKESSFLGCSSLESISFSKNVKRIEAYAFSGCESLQSDNLFFPKSLEKIDEYAFLGCKGLEEIVLSESVTKIGGYAFAECTGLRTVTIKNPSVEIGESVFRGCGNLKLKLKGDVSKYKELLKDYACYGINGNCKVSLDDGSEKTIKEFVGEETN